MEQYKSGIFYIIAPDTLSEVSNSYFPDLDLCFSLWRHVQSHANTVTNLYVWYLHNRLSYNPANNVSLRKALT